MSPVPLGPVRTPRFALPLIVFAFLATSAALPRELSSQESEPVSGRVLTPAGVPASNVEVRIVELRRQVRTDEDGSFRIDRVPAGDYLLEAASARLGRAVRRLRVAAGQPAFLELTLEPLAQMEPIIVTVSPEARALNEVYQPVSVIFERELAARPDPTLGAALAREPGVTSSDFGPAASRPVIRGLGGDRIRVLESGMEVGDVSTISPEHAVMSDPLAAERIEVVRGPATLLYGGSAVGGVVNVIDQRIPERLPERPLGGFLNLGGGTVADTRRGALRLTGGLGPVAWGAGYLRRKTEDYAIPGFAVKDEEAVSTDSVEERAFGVLPNSAQENEEITLGASYVSDAGYVGLAWSGYEAIYGVPTHGNGHAVDDHTAQGPGEPHLEGATDEPQPQPDAHHDEHVMIDQDLHRMDLRGELVPTGSPVRSVRVRLGFRDYEHRELEGSLVESRWTNEVWEGRLEALHRSVGPLSGFVGLELRWRDFAAAAEGEETAFVPPTETRTRALFVLEELPLREERWALQVGLRYESQVVALIEGGERSGNGLSSSAGVIWRPDEERSLALSVSRTMRIPTAEELFTNGPHAARAAFVIGDPALREETGWSADLSARLRVGTVGAELTVFASHFDDFIFDAPTGEDVGGLPVLRYVSRDARFFGGELQGQVPLVTIGASRITLDISGDYVHGDLVDTDEPLPRIPPLRTAFGLRYEATGPWALAEVRRVWDQDRVAQFELPTDGYTMLDVAAGYRFSVGSLEHQLTIQGRNLTNAEARNHVSLLKDVAPLPGRDLSLAYSVRF
jgi:iron complex outermembrane receptor protein